VTAFVAFDTETTGVEPGSRLVELAAVAFDDDGGVTDAFQRLVDPGMPMPRDASEANGITAADFVGAPDAGTVLGEFLSWIPVDAIMVAHNAPYDLGILSWEFARAGLAPPSQKVIDTLPMARNLGATSDNKLQTLVAHFGIDIDGDAHRAMPDADAVRQLFGLLRGRVPVEAAAWCSRYAYTDCFPTGLECLPVCVAKARRIAFDYVDKDGTSSRRSLTPYGWAATDKGLTVHGLCHLRGARRMFYADRISNLTEEG